MKLRHIWAAMAGLLAFQAVAQEAPVIRSDKDRISYSIGVEIARNFRKQEVEFDPDLLMKGVRDGMGDQSLLLPEKEVRRVLNGFRAELRQKLEGQRRLAATENRRKGEAFLAANRAQADVTTLPGGVQYKVLKAGDGRRPTDQDTVLCNYRGTLLDGTEFDATEPGHPATLQVARLIPGWKEALRHMPAGSRWQIVIPPQQAYGERGVGSDIGPNETLLFDVELLAVN